MILRSHLKDVIALKKHLLREKNFCQNHATHERDLVSGIRDTNVNYCVELIITPFFFVRRSPATPVFYMYINTFIHELIHHQHV